MTTRFRFPILRKVPIFSGARPEARAPIAMVAIGMLTLIALVFLQPASDSYAAGPGSWTISSTPNVGSSSELEAVATDPSGGVWAVGSYVVSSTGRRHALMLYKSPILGTWTTYPQVINDESRLYGVAATASNDVWVVGYQSVFSNPRFDTPLALHWDGSTWTQKAFASTGGAYHTVLFGVAVDPQNANSVWGVGYSQFLTGPKYTLVEKWNPSTQQFDLSSGVSGYVNGDNTFNAIVSYRTADSNWHVFAVGNYTDSNGYYQPLAEHWVNGTQDTGLAFPPNPGGYTRLYGLAVDSAGQVRAVGYNQLNSTALRHPLFERWDGANWVSPQVNTEQGELWAVAAVFVDPDATWMKDIWAVGNVGTTQSLVEHNDALSWSPVNQLATANQLFGLAVRPVGNPGGQMSNFNFSASEVWSVGNYFLNNQQHTLVLHYQPPYSPNAPNHTTSRYVQTTDVAIIKQWGCDQRSSGESGIVILAFGGPRNWAAATPNAVPTYGTRLTNQNPSGGAAVTNAQIESFVEAFADGYARPTCAPALPQPTPQHITIGIGTSNDVQEPVYSALNSGHGAAWGGVVNAVQTHIATNSYGSLEEASGATDIEPAWSGPTPVAEWISGYNSSTGRPYYNFGDCSGCSPENNMPNKWSATDIYNTSWGTSSQSHVLPQIYFYGQPGPIPGRPHAPMAEQWRRISLLGINHTYGTISFSGTMTEYANAPGTNQPAAGWAQLWQALNYDPSGRTASDVNWSTDIVVSP